MSKPHSRCKSASALPAIKGVPGLGYLPEFISQDDAAEIIEHIDAAPWSDELPRLVQHYGFKYDYRARRVSEDMRAAPLPDWATQIGTRMIAEGIFARAPDQVIVNAYLPGQGISSHVDCVPCFGDVIASLSLLSPCIMSFREMVGDAKVELDLAPRSLLVLSGVARYQWKHGITVRMNDTIDDVRRPRQRRVSVTFRTVNLE